MRNIKRIFITAIFISQCVAVPFVYAEGMKDVKGDFAKKWHEKMEKKEQEFYTQLGLTDEQKTLLENNKQKNRDDMKALREKKNALKDQLNQELMKPQLDMEQVSQIQSQMKAVSAQTADHRLNSILEVRKILTADQFSKFVSLMGQHKKERFGSSEEKE